MPPKAQTKTIKVQPSSGTEWVEARLQEPAKYTFTESGDYAVPAINPGETDKTIVPAEVLPASIELISENYAKKQDAIVQAEVVLAQARRNAMEVYRNYKNGLENTSREDVVSANLTVRDAEQVYMCTKTPARYIITPAERMSIKELHLEETYETRKNWDEVYILQHTNFPWRLSWALDPAELERERQKCMKKEAQATAPAVQAPSVPIPSVPTQPIDEEEAKRKANAKRAAIIAARMRAKQSKGGFVSNSRSMHTNYVVQKLG